MSLFGKDKETVKENKSFDLASLDLTKTAEEGAWLELLHPVTGEKIGSKIKLVGSDSNRFQDSQKRLLNKALNKKTRKKNKTISADEIEQDAIELLAACTISWEELSENGKVLDCTEENAKHIYSKYKWIKEQADEFIGDRENFLLN